MKIKYVDAIRKAMVTSMQNDPSVFIMGLGVDDHIGIFGSTAGLSQQFGKERVFDTPISEGAMTGVAIGAAINGLKPIHIHIRNDFMYLAMDQLFNIAAKWHYMFDGQMKVPLVVRAVIGRSWGQGAQHSQSLQSFFMHVPGIKVAMPTTAADAQGLLTAAIQDPNPVVLIEHRLLYDIESEAPESCEAMRFPTTTVRREGKDITLVANAYMVAESLKAAEFLDQHGISVEIVDPVTLVPLDEKPILDSLKKTGKVIVIDSGWMTCGMSAEIAAIAAEKGFASLKKPVRRLGMQQTTCPVSKVLEDLFYPSARSIAHAVFEMMERPIPDVDVPALKTRFKGPF